MNLLQKAIEKKENLLSMRSVRIMACQKSGKTIVSENGIVIPKNELQKYEDGYAFVTGQYAFDSVGLICALKYNR